MTYQNLINNHIININFFSDRNIYILLVYFYIINIVIICK